MIQALFTVTEGRYTGFSVSGHSEMHRPGKDILCAAVSSAVEMAANTITEVLKVKASVKVEENNISLFLPAGGSFEAASSVIAGLRLHLALLSKDYSGRIKVLKIGRINQ